MTRVEICQIKNATFAARGDSNHWVVMDDRLDFDGCEAAADPMELLLFALGGCTCMWLHALLKENGCKTPCISAGIEALREPGDSSPFQQIEINYCFYGAGLERQQLETLVRNMEKRYSAVYKMLSKAVPIRSAITIAG